MIVKGLEEQNCLLCQNLEASKAALCEILAIAIRKNLQVFETRGGTYFTLLAFLIDLVLTQTKLALASRLS